jgi:HAD superfamily phosphatase (TIGR01668 family)
MSRIYSILMQLWFLPTAPLRRNLITDIAPSIHHIDFESLKQSGVSLYIFDLDDTLANWHATIPKDASNIIRSLHTDPNTNVAILTNSTRRRVKKIERTLGIEDLLIVQYPTKPLVGGFEKILSHFGTDRTKAAMVGDRIATDMWGAKRAGIARRILVEPYSNFLKDHESPFIQKLIRGLEKLLYGYFFL